MFNVHILLVLISGSINFCISLGVCNRANSAISNNGRIYFQEKFCCDNFERHKDGKCHACRVGFTSKAGYDCIPCLQDTFGFRCAENCQCDQTERCDNVHGCVPKHYSNNFSTENSFTMINRTQSDSNNFQSTTFHPTTDVRPTRPNNEQHSGIWTSPKSTTVEKNNVFFDQKVLTYMFMAVAGAFVVIIGLFLCLICVCWKRHLSSKKKKITTSSSAVPLTTFPDIQGNVSDSKGTSGYEYEEIDESKLEREIPVIQHVSVKSSNNDSEVCGTDRDGYLFPYYSLVSINSISSKGVDDKNNENIYEEKPYLELSAEKECKNEVQQRENCELVINETVSKIEDETMYDVPKNTKSNGDKVVFF